MKELILKRGDATVVDPAIPTVLMHGCNDQGRWGAGFSGYVSKRSMIPEIRYRQAMRKEPRPTLGSVILVRLNKTLVVANAITQHEIITNKPKDYIPFQIDALRTCLQKLRGWLEQQVLTYTVQMPKIGAGFARGNWEEIESVIRAELSDKGWEVIVYY